MKPIATNPQLWKQWHQDVLDQIVVEYHTGASIKSIATKLRLKYATVGAYLRSKGLETHAGARGIFTISPKEIVRRATIEREAHFVSKRMQSKE